MARDPFARLRAAIARLQRSSARGAGPGAVGFMRITIADDSAENGRGLDRLFDAFEATIDDMPGIFEAAVPEIRRAHRQVFETEGSSGRGQWEGLAARTREERASLGYGPDGPILRRTGALMSHVLNTPAVITRTAGGVELKIRPDRSVGGVPKYDALAKGYAAGNLPGRPMVALGPAAAARVTSAVQRAFRDSAQARGLR